MIAKRCVLFSLSLFVFHGMFGPTAAGQETADPVIKALRERVTKFLEDVSLGTTQSAYEELLVGSPLRTQTEAVQAFVEKTDLIESRYGEYLEFEPIFSRRVGNDLVLMRYLYKCENFPVVFYFTFYRPPRKDVGAENTNWRVVTVRFDTELELLALAPRS
jgi:hypothetical protein